VIIFITKIVSDRGRPIIPVVLSVTWIWKWLQLLLRVILPGLYEMPVSCKTAIVSRCGELVFPPFLFVSLFAETTITVSRSLTFQTEE